MNKVFTCGNCGNVTRFDQNGDGRCAECGEIMESSDENKLSSEDKVVLTEKDEEGSDPEKPIDLEHGGKDLLDR